MCTAICIRSNFSNQIVQECVLLIKNECRALVGFLEAAAGGEKVHDRSIYTASFGVPVDCCIGFVMFTWMSVSFKLIQNQLLGRVLSPSFCDRYWLISIASKL